MGPAAASPAPPGVRVITDIAYAPPQPPASQGHLLDLYLPTPVERPLPVVIWSRGSAWRAENGREEAEVGAAHLTPHGFAVAGVAIRSSGHAQFLADRAPQFAGGAGGIRANAGTARRRHARRRGGGPPHVRPAPAGLAARPANTARRYPSTEELDDG